MKAKTITDTEYLYSSTKDQVDNKAGVSNPITQGATIQNTLKVAGRRTNVYWTENIIDTCAPKACTGQRPLKGNYINKIKTKLCFYFKN